MNPIQKFPVKVGVIRLDGRGEIKFIKASKNSKGDFNYPLNFSLYDIFDGLIHLTFYKYTDNGNCLYKEIEFERKQ